MPSDLPTAIVSPEELDSVLRACLRMNLQMARRCKRTDKTALRRLLLKESLAFRKEIRRSKS